MSGWCGSYYFYVLFLDTCGAICLDVCFYIRCRMVPILPIRTAPIVYLDFLGFKYKKSRGLLFTRFVSHSHKNSTTAVQNTQTTVTASYHFSATVVCYNKCHRVLFFKTWFVSHHYQLGALKDSQTPARLLNQPLKSVRLYYHKLKAVGPQSLSN